MLRFFIYSSTLFTLSAFLLLSGFLLHASWPIFSVQGLHFITSSEWYPYEDLFGMLPALLGSLLSVAVALLIALPLGVAAALFNIEIMPSCLRPWLRLLMELMAGIPSVVYGLMGLWLLVPFLEQQLELLTGRTLLAAALLLSIMVLPTIMVLSEDALRKVADDQRQRANALGFSWWAVVQRILLPQAWPGIRLAALLSLGRAMGETVAVMLVIGSIDRLPEPLYNLLQPAQSLTSRIGREIGEASVGSLHWSALMSSGLLLMLMSVAVVLLSQRRWLK